MTTTKKLANTMNKLYYTKRLFAQARNCDEGNLPKPITPWFLDYAEYKGLFIPKDKLFHDEFYYGECRNASIALWNNENKHFTHLRSKAGSVFLENINHPADDNGYDLFVPYVHLGPNFQGIDFVKEYIEMHNKLSGAA